jgi:hypothetical protein
MNLHFTIFRKSLYDLTFCKPKAGKIVLSPRFEPNDEMLAGSHNNSDYYPTNNFIQLAIMEHEQVVKTELLGRWCKLQVRY